MSIANLSDTVYIVRAKFPGKNAPPRFAYFSSEPQKDSGTKYGWLGGFGDFNEAIVFTTAKKAHNARNRAARRYKGMRGKIGVLEYTRKELFKAKLK